MEEYIEVRRLRHQEGLSVRQISRQTGIHRKTIDKILEFGAPPGYRRKKPPRRPVLGPFIPMIEAIFDEDEDAPPKQRHTAKRIFDRLREEHGYPGGYTQIKDYVRQAKLRSREAFVPLMHEPGEAQVDWGEAWVMDDGVRRKVHMFVMTLPFSDGRFTAAFPRSTLEFFIEGHRRAFEFFGGVPRQVTYDNLKSVVIKIHRKGKRKGERTINKTFEKFLDYHLITAKFCNVARGNEKGHVENGVGWARRNLLTPVPRLKDWADFNQQLAEGCRKHQDIRVRGHEETIETRLKKERTAFLPVPPFMPDDGQPETWGVSSLCLVRFDNNDYSVPCEYAYHQVTIRADVAQVRIFYQDRCIAVHTRCHQKEKAFYEPWHYLPLVEQKPRTLDDGAPLRGLDLDPCFEVLRRRMEADQERGKGVRAYIRVLMHLKDHSQAALTRAVKRALELHVEDEEAIKNLLLCPPEVTPSPLDLTGRGHLQYPLPPPNLVGYQMLVAGGAP